MEQPATPNSLPPMVGGDRPASPSMPTVAEGQSAGTSSGPGPERFAGGAEQAAQSQGRGQQPYIAPPSPPPVQPVTQAVPDPTANGTGVSPTLADDVDVIEKEWVDRAKQIVAATTGDPHAQERQVSELQSDYLKKRYGKDLATPER